MSTEGDSISLLQLKRVGDPDVMDMKSKARKSEAQGRKYKHLTSKFICSYGELVILVGENLQPVHGLYLVFYLDVIILNQ